MPRFIISGIPQEILTKLEAVKVVAEMRNDEGWVLFQYDENWVYETRMDVRVCPVCNSFEGIFLGDKIPVEFPYWKRLEKNLVYPNTHEAYPFLEGECRCELWWSDYFGVLTERLWSEMEAAAS